MALGLRFTCQNCGQTYLVSQGLGRDYPAMCREAVQEMKEGKHGPEWQKLVEKEPVVAINAVRELYICRSCGKWVNERNLSVYRPGPKTKNWLGDASPKDGVVDAFSEELVQYFERVRIYPHRCPSCGRRMRRWDLLKLETLPCPFCGTKNKMEPRNFHKAE